jgi:acyl-CoA synthetase (AMP-forming)/AMP-acid ligase II
VSCGRDVWSPTSPVRNSPLRNALSVSSRLFQDAEGYLYILDRVKDMIVTSGEVEAVLYEHPAIREAAVFGIPDAKWGELVMACVVLKPGVALSVDELIAHCRRSLASYKIPRRVEFSDLELPKTGSGKILERALRERFWAHQARAVS